MKYLNILIVISTASSVVGRTQIPRSDGEEPKPSVRNANHVFNAIRGAMRQWDSSWNHNGMSFFRATVPEGIQLYHGTHTDKAIEGTEWLAFEPEHAIGFAHVGMRPPPESGPSPPPPHTLGDFLEEMEHFDLNEEKDTKERLPQEPPASDDLMQGRHRRPPPPPEKCHRDYHHSDKRPPPPPPPPHPRIPDPGHNRSCHHPPPQAPPPPRHPDHPDDHPHHPHAPPPSHWPFSDPPRDRNHNHEPPPPPNSNHCDCHVIDMPPPPPHRGQPGRPKSGDDDELHPISTHSPKETLQWTMHLDEPTPPSPPDGDSPEKHHGYLHFYRTLHPLNLLLIDGLSAGKTGRGTLDSQDYALLQGKSPSDPQTNRTHLVPFMDGYRANSMCNMSRDAWNNRIDGFIRMEGGFEIILCDFRAHLELIRAQEVIAKGNDRRFGGLNSFRFYQAIADRFHGIGGQRVEIDYTRMVSAFSYDFDLFVNDSVIPRQVLPRLQNVSQTNLELLLSDITSMVLSDQPQSSVDWQAVADMVVQHFANPLQQLVSPYLSPGDEFASTLTALLRPLISDGSDDIKVITQRCVEQFVPLNYPDTLAGQVVHEVTDHICSTLVTILGSIPTADDSDDFNIDEEPAMTEARDKISSLIAYLSWPVWRECNPGCGADEVCVIPIWPITSKIEDRIQPTCKNATQFAGDNGPGGPGRRGDKNYWYDEGEGPGGPRGPGGPKPRRPGTKPRSSGSRFQ